MAKTKQDSDRLSKILEQLKNKQGENVVTVEDFRNKAISNAADSTYVVDTVLLFPESAEGRIGMEEFKSLVPGGDSTFAPFIWVDTEKHGPKKVFLTQLGRTVMPYVEKDGEFIQEGDPIEATSKLHEDARSCHDFEELLNLVLGKNIICYDVLKGKTARYRGQNIVGIRSVQVACFRYEDEEIEK